MVNDYSHVDFPHFWQVVSILGSMIFIRVRLIDHGPSQARH